MNDFNYYTPTRIHFGKGKIERAGKEILRYGKQILLAYGGGSIKRTGIYYDVVNILKEFDISFVELSGIRPNPSIESVREGIALCRQHNLKFILAVGGGSVIDCAKAIAAGVFYDGDPWDFFIRKTKAIQSLPLGSVLTLSATGSEMNGGTVISNDEVSEKLPYSHEILKPKFSILDPQYTFSVDAYQTAAGVADIISHCLEQYFSTVKGTYVQDRLTEGIIKTCIHYGPLAIKEPENYEARANLMWASSLALAGILTSGKEGDWATHYIEHKISAISDLTHGIGLAIITPAWMEEVLDNQNSEKFVTLADNIWRIKKETDKLTTAKECIHQFRHFFNSLGIPASLSALNIHLNENELHTLSKDILKYGTIGKFKKLGQRKIYNILKMIS